MLIGENTRRKLWKTDLEMIKNEGLMLHKCERVGKTLTFFCPTCLKEHTHGVGGVGPFTPTHRVEHCDVKTGVGYYIHWE